MSSMSTSTSNGINRHGSPSLINRQFQLDQRRPRPSAVLSSALAEADRHGSSALVLRTGGSCEVLPGLTFTTFDAHKRHEPSSSPMLPRYKSITGTLYLLAPGPRNGSARWHRWRLVHMHPSIRLLGLDPVTPVGSDKNALGLQYPVLGDKICCWAGTGERDLRALFFLFLFSFFFSIFFFFQWKIETT
ncbi:hypothetical protein VTI74DRAFT_1286 [Chaetomium olivicolor]